jgi:long-chain acyl-CoA synthetase
MISHPSVTHDEASRILMTVPTRICDVVRPWADCSPDQPALVEAAGTWTYAQLSQAIAETAIWLQNLGVRPGDRVMIVCENCRAFVAVLLASATLDAWPVLVNPRLSAREVDEIRDHCRARRVIYTTSVSHQAGEHAKRHGAAIVAHDTLGPIAVGCLNERAEPEPLETGDAARVAALIYTSGTTGVAKGVMLTHRGLLFVAAVSARIRALTPDDRLYGVLPMSHAVGLSVVLLGTLLSGSTLYLAPRFDPVVALRVLEKDRLTIVLGAPAMFALLIEYTKLRGLGSLTLPALRIISSSSGPLHLELKLAVERLFGMVLHNGYGVTECSPNIAQTRIEEPRSDISVGRVFPGIEVKLAESDGKPVAQSEVGELWVRGPNVMKGYYRAPQETAAAIDAEGWFNTRDLARLRDGNLFVVGRTKELIVRFGFNVYPAEVEAVLNAHPAVARSAVISRSVKGAEGDEDVVAFVEPLPGSQVATKELAEYASQHLAPYKRPSDIIFVPTMPMTPTGKIVKGQLAKMAECRS